MREKSKVSFSDRVSKRFKILLSILHERRMYYNYPKLTSIFIGTCFVVTQELIACAHTPKEIVKEKCHIEYLYWKNTETHEIKKAEVEICFHETQP